MKNDKKKAELLKYVEEQKQRLSSIPEKHSHRSEVFKAMILLDIKKTLARIEKL